PASRMPNMLLDAKEALDLAHFLCDASGPKDHKLPSPPVQLDKVYTQIINKYVQDPRVPMQLHNLPEDAVWAALGKHITEGKGCDSCHTIAPEGKALSAFTAAP